MRRYAGMCSRVRHSHSDGQGDTNPYIGDLRRRFVQICGPCLRRTNWDAKANANSHPGENRNSNPDFNPNANPVENSDPHTHWNANTDTN